MSVRRGCAWVLVVLATLPFTAPFSTIDVGMLLTESSTVSTAAPNHPEACRTSEVNEPRDVSPGAMLDESKDVALGEATIVAALTTSMPTVTLTVAAPVVGRSPLVALRL